MNKTTKLGILSISLLTIMSNSTMIPALPAIKAYFDNPPQVYVDMIISLPALFIVVLTLLSGKLVHIMKKKQIIYLGLVLFAIGGLGASFQSTLFMVLVFRAVLGIGLGLILPLTTGLISDFYKGNERQKMMGFATASNNFGGIFATVLAGYLAVYSWRYPFYLFGLSLPIIFIVFFFIPDQEIDKKPEQHSKVPKNVWFMALANITLMLAFLSVPIKLGFLVQGRGIGDESLVGILNAIITVGSFMFGMTFFKIKEVFKDYTMFLGIVILIIGTFMAGIFASSFMIGIGMFLSGAGIGIVAPSIYLQTSIESEPKDVTFNLAIVYSALFFGQFVTPMIIGTMQNLIGYNTIEAPYIISGVLGMIMALVILINKKIRLYKPKDLGQS